MEDNQTSPLCSGYIPEFKHECSTDRNSPRLILKVVFDEDQAYAVMQDGSRVPCTILTEEPVIQPQKPSLHDLVKAIIEMDKGYNKELDRRNKISEQINKAASAMHNAVVHHYEEPRRAAQKPFYDFNLKRKSYGKAKTRGGKNRK